MKKIISLMLAMLFTIAGFSAGSVAKADNEIDIGDIEIELPSSSFDPTGGEYATIKEGDWRIVMGANLTDEERSRMFALFGVEPDADPDRVLTVTNEEERFYFEGKLPSAEIGTRSISCIYIKALKKGSGLTVTTHNVDYCTEDMYKNVLNTVGITDATVIVASPKTVSGTAALTGIYKAYESLTGQLISEYIKAAGIDELITTGMLAEMIGSDAATAIITELKKILDQTQNMTDDEVKEQIRAIADEYGVILTENQISQILTLARTLEGLDIEQLRQRLFGIADSTVTGWEKFANTIVTVVGDIGGFFSDIAEFFRDLFVRWFGGEG